MTDQTLEPTSPLLPALIALPFAALMGLGWQTWIPWPAILVGVLIVWGFRRFPNTAQYAPYSSVFAALAVFLAPLSGSLSLGGTDVLSPEGLFLVSRLGTYFVAFALMYLLGSTLDGVQSGSRWAWLGPLIVFVAQPNAVGALGGLGLAVLGALEGRGKRQGDPVRSRGAFAAIGLAGILMLVLTVPWGGPGGLIQLEGQSATNLEQTNTPAASTTEPEASPRTPRQTQPLRGFLPPQAPFMILNTVILAFLIGYLILALRERAFKRQGRNNLADLIPIVAAVVFALLVYLYGASSWLNGSSTATGNSLNDLGNLNGANRAGRGSQATAPNAPLPADENPWLTAILAVLAAGVLLWRILRQRATQLEAPALEPASDELERRIQATHRVRAAYRAFLELAGSAGVPRANSETPQEFADRVSAKYTEAHAPAHTLTRLYEPVRYGQLSDESGALEAETALETLRGILKDTMVNA